MIRGVLTLLVGSGAAQLGPLLFGPVLSRLYGPEAFGVFHLATAIGANLAVVACARYEFALPLAQDEAEARALRALCVRLLWGVGALCALGAVMAAAWWSITWPLMVPAMVASLGALSLWTLEATRSQRVTALAWARVSQFWGGSALQAALGVVQAGLWGLLIGPVVAAAATAWGLWRGAPSGPSTAARSEQQAVARRHRDFPLLNTPHAFLGALQDTASIALIAAAAGPAAAGVWGLALRYLKAPATLAGGAVSQVLYPQLGQQQGPTPAARTQVRRVMQALMVAGVALGLVLAFGASWLLPPLLGSGWEASGPLAQALAIYIALHFVASPLGVVTLAWQAQAWALRVALAGQLVFIAALALGLWWGPQAGLQQAAWAVSFAMAGYFGWYFARLWNWPVNAAAEGGADPRDNSVP